jgi:hypothetical protein
MVGITVGSGGEYQGEKANDKRHNDDDDDGGDDDYNNDDKDDSTGVY